MVQMLKRRLGGREACKTHFSSHRRYKGCIGQQPDLYREINQFTAAVDSHLYTGLGRLIKGSEVKNSRGLRVTSST